MADRSRRTASSQLQSVGEAAADAVVVAGEENGSAEDELRVARLRLRKRWELASVLNFLGVFDPLIEDELNLTAEEIEMALIRPNVSLAKIHVALLKGIPPVSKSLSKPDAWVTVLCKKLADWWPWVAERKIPLMVDKGEEISRYKKLDPTERLLMLKALCELRTEQADFLSYINDMIKQGTEPSSFRKDKVGGDGCRIAYWHDGHEIIGHRLYREAISIPKSKIKGKASPGPPANCSEWDTLATNLDEFRKVLDEFSSSKVKEEVAVCKVIETNVIPVLEKLEKKRERALKRQQRQDSLLNGYHAYPTGSTRSCRTRKPVSYTFDEYDQAINEAIQLTKKPNPVDKRKRDHDHGMGSKAISNEHSDSIDNNKDGFSNSMDTNHESDDSSENVNHSDETRSTGEEDSDHDHEDHNSGHSKRSKHNTNGKMENGTSKSVEVFARRLNGLRSHSNNKKPTINNDAVQSGSDNGSSSDDPSEQNSAMVADSEDETSS